MKTFSKYLYKIVVVVVTLIVALSAAAAAGLFCGDFFGLSIFGRGWAHLTGDPWFTGAAGDASL